MNRQEQAELRARAVAGPVLIGSPEVLELLDEIARLRASLARRWAAELERLLTDRLDDGTPVIELVLAADPRLATRLREVVMEGE